VYFLWFQQDGVAEGVLDSQARLLFDRMMRAPMAPEQMAQRMFVDGKLDMNPFRRLGELEPETELIVTPEELDVYVKAFEESGFRGGINWYRNIDRNSREHPGIGTQKLTLPCLMITAEWDAALRPELAGGMPAVIADLEIHQVGRAGHWVQQEYPTEVNRLLVDWLGSRFS
jgi:pimeloyl-ACP methyl ester carboxylesterase